MNATPHQGHTHVLAERADYCLPLTASPQRWHSLSMEEAAVLPQGLEEEHHSLPWQTPSSGAKNRATVFAKRSHVLRASRAPRSSAARAWTAPTHAVHRVRDGASAFRSAPTCFGSGKLHEEAAATSASPCSTGHASAALAATAVWTISVGRLLACSGGCSTLASPPAARQRPHARRSSRYRRQTMQACTRRGALGALFGPSVE